METDEKSANFAWQRELWYMLWQSGYADERDERNSRRGLDSVDPMVITEVLENHLQPLSNEELCDLAQQLTEQLKEDEDEEDRGTKEMQKKDLTDILSAIDMAAEKLCDIDPEWERSTIAKKLCKGHAKPVL